MAKKLQVTIVEIHARGQRGFSKTFTMDGAVGLKQAFRRIKELFNVD